jgi:hypothetical protein
MKVTNHSVQPFLFRHKQERFKLESRAIVAEAPDWVMNNKYATSLREEEKISFQVEKQPSTLIEKLRLRADGLGLSYGDGAKTAALESMIKAKEKELEDAKK